MAPSIEVRSPSPGTARALAAVPMDVEIDLEWPLHFLAASDTIQALEAAKRILDAQTHPINAHEPDCGLTPLHIAASWGNLGMCQLLYHYGADITALDEDSNTCVDLVQADSPEVAKFFRKITSNDVPQQRILKKVLTRVFGWPKHLRKEAVQRRAKKKAQEARKKQTRPVSCFSAFAEVPESPLAVRAPEKTDVRRRSSHLKQQPSDNDIAQVMDALSVQPMSRGSRSGVPKTPVKSVQPEGVGGTKSKRTHSESVLPPDTGSALPRSTSDVMATPTTSSRLYPDLPAMMKAMDLNKPLPVPHAETPPPIPPQRVHSKFTRTPTAPPLSCENTPEGTPERDPEIRRLTISQLRSRLLSAGISPGPLGKENRTLYEKKLISVEQQQVASYSNAVFSAALDRAIRQSTAGSPKSDVGQIQEDIIRNEFCLGPSVTREAQDFSSYCYLLLDPSKVTNQQKCTFKEFIDAIFYVGKGKGFRSRQHLFEAINAQPGGSSKKPITKKQKRIQDIWKTGNGVIALHVFNNINPMEALIREAAMIDAFGLKNLTNQKGGEYNGLAKSWTLQEKTKFGVFCLQSAWGIFQHDRARPVFEAEVIEVYKQQKFYKPH